MKILKKNLVYNIKNLSILSVFNLIKFIIKIITRLSAIFGFSVLIYFDTSLLPNIYDGLLTWFKNFKISNLKDYFYYIKNFLKNIFNNILKYIRDIIDSLVAKDKPIDENKKIYDVNSEVDIGDYKFDRKDYKTNVEKFLDKKNSTSTTSTSNDKFYSFIYSPYFYVPCIIIITLSATYVGAFVYYNYDIEYVSYINSLGIYLKKGITYLFRGEDDLPVTPTTPVRLEDINNIVLNEIKLPSPTTSTSSSETITPSINQFDKYFKEIPSVDSSDVKTPTNIDSPSLENKS